MEQLHTRWTRDEQRAFLDSRYLGRLNHADRNSGRAHFGTMLGRFVIGGASLAPTLTAAGAVANSGIQFWLKIIGIVIGAMVAVATATMGAVRASSTWQTYYGLRVELEAIGWQAAANRTQDGADPEADWDKFVTTVNKAIDAHSKRYTAEIVDPSVSQPGT
jgi:hypothetical protein